MYPSWVATESGNQFVGWCSDLVVAEKRRPHQDGAPAENRLEEAARG